MATKPRIPVEYRDSNGRAVASGTVTVYDAGTTNLSTIYDPNDVADATISIANPNTTDSNGRFCFAATAGYYTIVLSGGASPTVTLPYIPAATP